MSGSSKGWPSTLIVSDQAEHQTLLQRGFMQGGFGKITVCSFGEARTWLDNTEVGLVVVDLSDEAENKPYALIEHLARRDSVILAVTPRIDQRVVRAIKAGADSVAQFPVDLARIGLPAILAFDRASLRRNLRKAQAEVEELRRLGYARIRSIVHDLKNPLTVTMGNLQVIQAASGDIKSENIAKMLNNALRGCRMQLNMMSNLSDLVKIEEGRLHPRLEAVDPVPIIEKAIAEFKATDHRKSYSFQNRSQAMVLADRAILERVFQNLLAHASHYTRDGNHIEVTLDRHPAEGFVILIVQDDGEAIPESLGDDIFECAVKALDDSNHTRWDRGMMLAYARRAMRATGGDVDLDGLTTVGARIRVKMPIHMAAASLSTQ